MVSVNNKREWRRKLKEQRESLLLESHVSNTIKGKRRPIVSVICECFDDKHCECDNKLTTTGCIGQQVKFFCSSKVHILSNQPPCPSQLLVPTHYLLSKTCTPTTHYKYISYQYYLHVSKQFYVSHLYSSQPGMLSQYNIHIYYDMCV